MNDMVTVASFVYVHQAYVLKSKLESEGIPCQITNEHTLQVYHFLSNAMGGAQLQVSAENYNRATEIMKDAGLEPDAGAINPLLKTLLLFAEKLPFAKSLKPLTRLFLFTVILLSLVVSLLVISTLNTTESSNSNKLSLQQIEHMETMTRDNIFYEQVYPKIDSLSFANPERALKMIDSVLVKGAPMDLFWEKGTTLYNLKAFSEAIRQYYKLQRWETEATQTPHLWFNMALCYEGLFKYDSAVYMYKRIQDSFELSNHFLGGGRNQQNVARKTLSYEIYTWHFACLMSLGRVYEELEKPKTALAYYQDAQIRAIECTQTHKGCKRDVQSVNIEIEKIQQAINDHEERPK